MVNRPKRCKANGVQKRQPAKRSKPRTNGVRKRQNHSTDPVIQRLRGEPGMMGKIASELGIARQATSLWRSVPANRVLDVERITGIPRHEIRPDYYPPPPKR